MTLPAPVLALVSIIVGAAIIAATVTFYQRETTGIDTKYLGRSGVEIDATYVDPLNKITEGPNYSDSNNPGTGGNGVFLGDDADFDGLTITQEQLLGTDIDDPDTDDDGASDGIEVLLNTDPKDPTSGGLAYIPYPIGGVPPIGNETPAEKLILNRFYKQVRNLTKGEAVWQDSTTAAFGDTVAFIIHLELTNPSSAISLSATIADKLGKGLQYINDSGFIVTMNSEPEPLPPLWRDGHSLTVSPELNPQKPVTIEITFNVAVVNDPLIQNMDLTVNQAILTIQDKVYADSAIVRLNK
ncbi:TPA: hypothetical protein DCR79_00250 [Patescibacteria group bacterium]|uniref:Outer membrane adhesin-like protein, nonfunctional n=2 Tax=Bacteria division Kazan-3B-28 TaxID=1798534 RepID=A0A0G1KUI4_UNCK3|nr:MAG: outer membrane adhesin-like protein, nonfunctional [candidate division Kazan bacterium GW2011_GWA1_44_22]KKT87248.1 MAG: outer membrane adhesin-like protein, nonfunctional [candidate division Kazan bacterium GW2011_GWB1_45_10]HAR54713.1 hypothetical protein [Patescibacteria group bacterium]HCR42182.1 hypothetical protein [Patescibacteria group bacterium]